MIFPMLYLGDMLPLIHYCSLLLQGYELLHEMEPYINQVYFFLLFFFSFFSFCFELVVQSLIVGIGTNGFLCKVEVFIEYESGQIARIDIPSYSLYHLRVTSSESLVQPTLSLESNLENYLVQNPNILSSVTSS